MPILHCDPTAPDLEDERHVINSDIEFMRDLTDLTYAPPDEKIRKSWRHEAPNNLVAAIYPYTHTQSSTHSTHVLKGKAVQKQSAKPDFEGVCIPLYPPSTRASSRGSVMDVDMNVARPSTLPLNEPAEEAGWEAGGSGSEIESEEWDSEASRARTRAAVKKGRERRGCMPKRKRC
ncbi:hypothetical protein FRC09_010739 [Ceratobasidium sp. 395]|nr:hypothetical protein FRC09_010739 [Ceratobasidium sp. 395]